MLPDYQVVDSSSGKANSLVVLIRLQEVNRDNKKEAAATDLDQTVDK